MRKKLITVAIVAIEAVASGYALYRRAHAQSMPAYRTAAVQRGKLESTVAATGTLGAVTTVQVGTQVSGQISAIYVDFNSKVKKGQLIARIDPTLQQQAVADAQAGVARAQAQLTQTGLEYDRTKLLHDQRIVTDPQFNTAQLSYQVAKANGTSAQIALESQKQEVALEVKRAYLEIHSAGEQLAAAQAQLEASDLAVTTSQQRYQAGAGTLVELTQARAAQVQAASAVVSARYGLVFQQALMSFYTGALDPGRALLAA